MKFHSIFGTAVDGNCAGLSVYHIKNVHVAAVMIHHNDVIAIIHTW